MAQLHYMSFSDFHSSGIFSTQSNIVQYCMQVGILQSKQRCSKCSADMYLLDTSTDDFTDGFCWTCPTCPQQKRSIRRDSILERRKIPLLTFLQVLWHSCNTLSVSQTAKQESLSPKTVRSIYTAIRHCMIEDLLITPPLIGGPGKIVEIDESIIGKRKYNRGRIVKGKWLLGGTERGSNDCFLVECENNHRDHHVLIRLIKQYVRPGTLIITDRWKGYVNLSHHGYIHEDVNHSRDFVNPATGAHTNTIEGCWFHVKRHLQRGIGWLRNDPDALALALAEFMWRKRHNITSSPEDCRRFFCVEFPRLMKRIFNA